MIEEGCGYRMVQIPCRATVWRGGRWEGRRWSEGLCSWERVGVWVCWAKVDLMFFNLNDLWFDLGGPAQVFPPKKNSGGRPTFSKTQKTPKKQKNRQMPNKKRPYFHHNENRSPPSLWFSDWSPWPWSINRKIGDRHQFVESISTCGDDRLFVVVFFVAAVSGRNNIK